MTAVLAGWEAYVTIRGIRPLTLPRPSEVILHVVENPAFYWENSLVTLLEAFCGFWMAFCAAALAATWMAHSRLAERAGLPVVVLVQSMPVVVLLPVFLLWFGFSPWPKILTAMLFAWAPFTSNALTGLRSIAPDTLELLRSVHASRWEVYWRLRVPNSLPYLFSAGRFCVALSLMGAVTGEFFVSKDGLGNAAHVAYARSLVHQLWGSVFVLALLGVAIALLVAAAERRVLHWHASHPDLHSRV